MASPSQPEYLQANPARRNGASSPTRPQAPAVSIETAYFRSQSSRAPSACSCRASRAPAGFPYGLGASLPVCSTSGWNVLFRAARSKWSRLAMAAVEFLCVARDFADEIIAQQPDAVIVYVGHNEFLGILGVGSSMRLAATPGIHPPRSSQARDWRLFQLMSQLSMPDCSRAGAMRAGASARIADGTGAGERSIAAAVRPVCAVALAAVRGELGRARMRSTERAGVASPDTDHAGQQ